ncbi:MAG: pyridoxamine kinase [Clostridia bacterium]|nr:pyridoxamine kinase [Clostridia bacterium]
MSFQKRAVTINDISGIGKCSVTVALPILSAAGIESSVLPTALLSTHTGGFDGFTFLDLTDEMTKIINHWDTLDIKFDAIYSGYLGSTKQMEIVESFIDRFKEDDTLVLVDPVMADAGKFYSGFSEDYLDGMRKLCSKADIIVPNITEALFLSDREYDDGPYDRDTMIHIMKELSITTGCPNVVVTGINLTDNEFGAASYSAKTDSANFAIAPHISGFYHGAGDVFASSLLAALLNDNDLEKSTEIAVDFTEQAIIRTRDAGTDTRFGVNFEAGLPKLIKQLGL